jgi:excisionase family DNA binding protein
MRTDSEFASTPLEGEVTTLIDIGALALHLDVTERFIRRLVEERRIPFCKIGKFVRFHPDDVNAWIAANRVDQQQQRR